MDKQTLKNLVLKHQSVVVFQINSLFELLKYQKQMMPAPLFEALKQTTKQFIDENWDEI